jgi:hypothetical protein
VERIGRERIGRERIGRERIGRERMIESNIFIVKGRIVCNPALCFLRKSSAFG